MIISSKNIIIPDNIKNKLLDNIKIQEFQIMCNLKSDINMSFQGNDCLIKVGIVENLNNNSVNENFYINNPKLDGQFTIFSIVSNKITIATDFININRFAYFFDKYRGLIISDNLDYIQEIIKFNFGLDNYKSVVDPVGILESLGFFYTTFGTRTILRDVNYLYNGCVVEFNEENVKVLAYDTIDRIEVVDKNFDYGAQLKLNSDIFFDKFSHFCFPVSGGVDSRITLFSFRHFLSTKNSYLFTHGEMDDVEVKIVRQLASELKVNHKTVSIQNLYPNLKEVNANLDLGWNWVLGKWLPIINSLKNEVDNSSVFILGDTLDLLRAKNLKSIRTRKQRILLQLGISNFDYSGSITDLIEKYKKSIISDLNKTYDNYRLLFEILGVNRENLFNDILNDIEKTLDHVKLLFNPIDSYQFEEGLNLVLWGRGTMGNQCRQINQYFSCYVAHANRRFIKLILKISPTERFEDKITHRVLKLSSLSNYPTAQIPIFPYKYPLILKYIFWTIRSMIDQYYMKFSRKLGFKKNRIFKMQNWQSLYSDPVNTMNYKSYFENVEELFGYILSYYEKRSNGKSRSLSEIDLTNAAQIALILRKTDLKF